MNSNPIDITLTQIKYALAVYRLRHFGKAASECYVSQPSLSAQIQKLESQLGYPIFDRSKKPIITTDLGLVFLQQCQQIMIEVSALNDLQPNTGKLQGTLRVGVIPTLAPYLIPLFLTPFAAKYPKVNLIIEELQTNYLLEALEKDALDLGILVTPLGMSQFTEEPLFYEPFSIFTAKTSELFKKKRIKENDLGLSPVWLLAEGHCLRDQVLSVCKKGQHKQVIENVSFNGGSLETIIQLIKKGDGYTLLPFLATQQLNVEDQENHLRRFQKPTPTREVSFVYQRKVHKEIFRNALREVILQEIPDVLKNLKKEQVEVLDLY